MIRCTCADYRRDTMCGVHGDDALKIREQISRLEDVLAETSRTIASVYNRFEHARIGVEQE